MAIRIRVYPQTGALGMNGLGMGGAVSASTYYNSKLQTQKQVSNLQLGYERALWSERLDKVRLEERLKNPYAALQTGSLGAYGGVPVGALGLGTGLGLGALGYGALGGLGTTLPMTGVPQIAGGSGQTNVTNQTSTGGNQTVTNANTFNNATTMANPYGGWGAGLPGFGGGGLISGLLGALI